MSDAINDFLGYIPDILPDFFESLRNGLLGITELIVIVENGLAMIQWNHWLRISVFILIELLLLVTVLYMNDRVYQHYRAAHIRRHHLTIRNHGNTASIFLLRPVELPNKVAIYFLVKDTPMIYVTRKKKEAAKAAEENVPEVKKAKAEKKADKKSASGGSLIPDLENPLEVREVMNREANKVRKTTGTLASIAGSLANLLPGKNKALQKGQDALKGVQQTTSETVSSVNSKFSSADMLKSQAGSLMKDKMPKDAAKNITADAKDIVSGKGAEKQPGDRMNEFTESKDFVYDENFWSMAKKEKAAQELGENYAQSRILNPDESMDIDIELRNLANGSEAITHMYKIEVTQIPQSKLVLAAPHQYINGIVTFQKVDLMYRVLPGWVMVVLIVVAAILLAAYGKFFF